MKSTALVGFFILVTLVSLCRPANAALTASLSMAGPNPYNGPCPVNVVFNGSINNLSSTPASVQYYFARYVNSTWYNGQTVNVTIPGNGSKAVSSTLNVDQTHSGFQSYEIRLTPTQTGSQPKVYFTVNCQKLIINPNVVNMVYVPSPTNLAQTTDAHVCGSHGAGFNCLAGFNAGWLGLVWCWTSGCGGTSTDQKVNNFNIYEVDGGKHIRVTQIGSDQYGNLPTAGFVQTPNGGFSNQCYAVTATYGSNESGNSNAVCLGSGSVGQFTAALHSTQSGTHDEEDEGGHGLPFISACLRNTPMCVGWHHDQSSIANIATIWHYEVNDRAYYLFDLSSLAGHYVYSATLKVPVHGGDTGCLSHIAAANQDWTNTGDYIGGNFQVPSGDFNTGFDVTDIVRSWMNGSPNYGFVLRGSNESFQTESSTCETDLEAGAELDIVHA